MFKACQWHAIDLARALDVDWKLRGELFVAQYHRDIARYDWVLFTSVNGVAMFFSRLKTLKGDIRDLKGVRIGAIGPKTSSRLEAFGLKVDAFPEEGETLYEASRRLVEEI